MTSEKKDGPDRADNPKRVAGSRRGFLLAGLAGATATAVVTGIAVTPAEASESEAEKKKARYQESAHVKKFYQTNRY